MNVTMPAAPQSDIDLDVRPSHSWLAMDEDGESPIAGLAGGGI